MFQSGHIEGRSAICHLLELVGMILHGIVRSRGRVVTVLPRALGQIQISDCGDDLVSKHRVPGLIVRVPYGYAGMITVVAHPLRVLNTDFLGIEWGLFLR